jgi:hypothetical protein
MGLKADHIYVLKIIAAIIAHRPARQLPSTQAHQMLD